MWFCIYKMECNYRLLMLGRKPLPTPKMWRVPFFGDTLFVERVKLLEPYEHYAPR